MSRFFALALVLSSVISALLYSSPASAAEQTKLTIADVQNACAPACSTADFTESGGQVAYRLDNRKVGKDCVTFTFNYAIIEFRVFLQFGRQRSGQVYPGQVARIDNVCAGIFTFRRFTTVPAEVVTAQKLCRPIVRCSLDHFVLEAGGLVLFDHELDGLCPGLTLAPGMFFDASPRLNFPYRYVEICQAWIGGTPVPTVFSDLSQAREVQGVLDLVLRDVVHGNGDGTFGASSPVLRAQTA
jgi:hypothetical protein